MCRTGGGGLGGEDAVRELDGAWDDGVAALQRAPEGGVVGGFGGGGNAAGHGGGGAGGGEVRQGDASTGDFGSRGQV